MTLGKKLEFGVRPVTEGSLLAVLAATKIDRSGLLGFEFDRRHTCVLVATITKWLLVTAATRAPVVIQARLHFNRIGRFLGNDRFGHEGSP